MKPILCTVLSVVIIVFCFFLKRVSHWHICQSDNGRTCERHTKYGKRLNYDKFFELMTNFNSKALRKVCVFISNIFDLFPV